MAVRRETLALAAQIMAQRLNADHSDCQGRTLPCECGRLARYAGRRDKTFVTALGEMTLKRAYYHCKHCKHGFYPRDRTLGLSDLSLSPATMRMTGIATAHVSFAQASTLLRELAVLRLDPKQTERAAEALGREIAKDEQQVIDVEPNSADTLYLGMDGTGIPMRASALQGRAGKQEDGSAKTREVKLVTVWSGSWSDEHNYMVRDPHSVTQVVAIESARASDTDRLPSVFAQRVEREASRREFHQAKRQVVIGDGARWIWNLTEELFPQAIQIVDLFHAKQHLWDVAKDIYGGDTDLTKQWARQRCRELDRSQIDTIVSVMETHVDSSVVAKQCIGYLRNNRCCFLNK